MFWHSNLFVLHNYQRILVLHPEPLLFCFAACSNYVIQYILKLRSPIINSRLVSQFSGHYITLSTQKFSSNVVERCLEHFGEEEGQAGIVRELLSAPQFEELLQDQYANYVIKAALNRTKVSSII